MGGKGSGSTREQGRLDKINEILQMVEGKSQPRNVIAAKIMLKYGTSRRTAGEYVQVLIDAGKIEEVEGLLQIK